MDFAPTFQMGHPLPFVLAERLGLTLAQVGALSNREHMAWRAFYAYRKAMAELDG